MLDKSRIPHHIAIIMDGNGRWAKKRNLPRVAGHNAGMESMKNIVRHASDLGVRHLTVYAFSTENWKRTQEEIGGIFQLLIRYIDKDLRELHEKNVRVRVLGDYSTLPKGAVKRLDKTLTLTNENTGLQFNIALNYGSRKEIAEGVRSLCKKVKDGDMALEDVTEEAITNSIMTGKEGIPDPDLLIRTSGEIRLSNYLLWQLAYSEMVFSKTLWPDYTVDEFEKSIEEFQNRDRRFGGRKE